MSMRSVVINCIRTVISSINHCCPLHWSITCHLSIEAVSVLLAQRSLLHQCRVCADGWGGGSRGLGSKLVKNIAFEEK